MGMIGGKPFREGSGSGHRSSKKSGKRGVRVDVWFCCRRKLAECEERGRCLVCPTRTFIHHCHSLQDRWLPRAGPIWRNNFGPIAEIREIQEEGNTIARSILRLEAPPHICPSSGFHRKITRGLKHSQENPALFHSDVLFLVFQLLLLSAEKSICKLLIQLLPYFTVLIQIYFSSSRRFIAVIVSAWSETFAIMSCIYMHQVFVLVRNGCIYVQLGARILVRIGCMSESPLVERLSCARGHFLRWHRHPPDTRSPMIIIQTETKTKPEGGSQTWDLSKNYTAGFSGQRFYTFNFTEFQQLKW